MKNLLLSVLSFFIAMVTTGCTPASTAKTGAGLSPMSIPEKSRMVNLQWKPTMSRNDFITWISLQPNYKNAKDREIYKLDKEMREKK